MHDLPSFLYKSNVHIVLLLVKERFYVETNIYIYIYLEIHGEKFASFKFISRLKLCKDIPMEIESTGCNSISMYLQ